MNKEHEIEGGADSQVVVDEPRKTMNGKPVFTIPAKTIIDFKSGFGHKLLCNDLSFSTGIACAFNCEFCFVRSMMRKQKPYLEKHGVIGEHKDIVIRRAGAIARLRAELTDRHGRPKYLTPDDRRVIYSSPSVDVAANMELVRETIEACRVILDLTNWDVRLLSKSNLLPMVARALPEAAKQRVIYGVSTGTLDDGLARAFEQGTPLVSKRIASLHWLQDKGFRTFAMFCPSLPQRDYPRFARDLHDALRVERCEHVWAEVLNVRGESMTSTTQALQAAGFNDQAIALKATEDRARWEEYARATFLAHAPLYPPGKLRFLQYVTKKSRSWWAQHQAHGAVLLGTAAEAQS